jgi:V/A-type H+-transporting ATPase subunit A
MESWFTENVGEDFMRLRAFIMNVLQEEANLDEIVRLVGMDALSQRERITMETAKTVREDYLHQNAFHEVDTYASLEKQFKMLKIIYDYDTFANQALLKDVEYEDVLNIPSRDKSGRVKYIPETEMQSIDEINLEINAELKALINGGGENA